MYADPQTQLSPNFKLHEFTASIMAQRHSIDNRLPTDLLANAMRTVTHIAQPVRDHFGIPFGFSSGWRCLALNRLLKSDDTSDHLKAQACDLEIPGVANLMLAHWMADNLPDFDKIIFEFYDPEDPAGGWVHGQYRNAATNRNQVLTYDGQFKFGLPPLGEFS